MIFRRLVRSPALTTAALLAVALGVGTTAAVLGVVDATRLRPLSFDDASSLVSVSMSAALPGERHHPGLTAADLADFRSEPGLFGALAGWAPKSPTYAGGDASRVVAGAAVTHGLFSGVLRAQPLLGRTFLPEEDRPGASPTVLLSHGFWSEQFGADPSVLGRAVALDGVPHVVVGVMPASFRPPFRPRTELWTTARLDVRRCRRACPTVTAVGRLAPGATLPVAQDRATALSAHLAESYPETNRGVTPALAPLRDERVRMSAGTASLLLASGGLVLLIACANVALLLLARGRERTGEMRIRRSVGASRGAIVGQLLRESVALSLAGGAIGVGVAVWSLEALTRMAPPGLFEGAPPQLRAGVLALVFLLTGTAGLVFGCIPARVSARAAEPIPGRRPRPRVRSAPRVARLAAGLRGALGGVELGIALSLAVAAGGLLHGLREATRERIGFDPDHLLTVRLTLPSRPLGASEDRLELVRRLQAGLAEVPGVFSVGAAGSLPLDEPEARRPMRVKEQAPEASEPPSEVTVRAVSEAYFYSMGQRLAEGRRFRAEDDAEADPVVILGTTTARRFFRDPPRSPLGAGVALGGGSAEWRTVVGVVHDEVEGSAARPPGAVVYVPLAQLPPERLALVARVDREPEQMVAPLRSALAEVDPGLRTGIVEPMTRHVAEAYAGERFGALLATAFALVALLLSVVGLFGILAHDVLGRLRELGLRRAVGATDDDLRRLVVGRAATVTVMGVAVGTAGAAFFAERIDAALRGVGERTPLVYATAVIVIVATVLVASSWPVRRSVSVDAAAALRPE